jgi:preprotein translocase subunit SecG
MVFGIYLSIHILLCLALVGLVLLQQGRGADLGAAFSGASNTIFGAGGADRLIVRLTTVVAILFMVSTIVLVNAFSQRAHSASSVKEATSDVVSELSGMVPSQTNESQQPVDPKPADQQTGQAQ